MKEHQCQLHMQKSQISHFCSLFVCSKLEDIFRILFQTCTAASKQLSSNGFTSPPLKQKRHTVVLTSSSSRCSPTNLCITFKRLNIVCRLQTRSNFCWDSYLKLSYCIDREISLVQRSWEIKPTQLRSWDGQTDIVLYYSLIRVLVSYLLSYTSADINRNLISL